MSVAIATGDRVDYGDVAAIGGLTGITIALTINITASTVTTDRFVTQWSTNSGNRAFIFSVVNTNEIAFLIGGASLFGRKTNVLNLVSGTQYRVMVTWVGDTPNVMAIWVDGVSQSVIVHVGSNDNASLPDGSDAVQVGEQTTQSIDGVTGGYSEFAIWDHVLPDGLIQAYGKGISPNAYPSGGIIYDRLINTTSKNEWGGDQPTHTGTTKAVHPSIVYPHRQRVGVPTVAAVGGGELLQLPHHQVGGMNRMHGGFAA